MPRQELQRVAFNRGLISKLALARVDLKRMAFSSEEMVNWMPRTLGSMMLRPGFGYLGAQPGAPRSIPFIKKRNDTAVMEFTASLMRVWVDDALITRPTVSSAVTNGTFATDLSSWTDNDDAGAASTWVASPTGEPTGGYMQLVGTGTAYAIRDQQVTVGGDSLNVEHALRIVIQRGPVTIAVGSSSGAEDYVALADLDTGTHSLSFTPTGNFSIRFKSCLERLTLVDSCTVEAAGVMTLPTPYTASDLDNIRAGPDSQSGDVVYIACTGFQQRKVERRGNARSWGISKYLPPDGPFRAANVGPITITPGALTGNTTLTASAPLFRSTQVGGLFQITSTGQTVTKAMTALNDVTSSVRVTGVGTDRTLTVSVSGITVGRTVVLQRSFDNSVWVDVASQSYTADTQFGYYDTLDNQIVYYRLKCTVLGAAGTTNTFLTISTGSIVGVARITSFQSSITVFAEVLVSIGSVAATDDWAEGEWSDYRGWPSAVAFCESRLVWAGKDKVMTSVTDAFDDFDAATEGDSGPITRSIGTGPVEVINWLVSVARLLVGGEGCEYTVRSSAFDDPLTPSNFNIKPSASAQGSSNVQAVKIDGRAMFVQAGGTRVFDLEYDGALNDYKSTDQTLMIPEIGGAEGTTVHIVRMGVQRQPDTRLHCVRSDGTAAVLVYDKAENVLCWIEVESPGASGLILDVVVKPAQTGSREDQVYYTVQRTINGATVYYFEKWALESECLGSTLNKQADSFIQFTNSPANTVIGGLTHLIGQSVVVWADGACPEDANEDAQTYTVNASGQIVVGSAVSSGVVGLAYDAEMQSAKLGQALTHFKQVEHIGLILKDTHSKGLKFGPTLDDDDLDNLPLMYNGARVTDGQVYSEFDQEPIPFPGGWDTDSRICLKASAPRPATVLAAIVDGLVT